MIRRHFPVVVAIGVAAALAWGAASAQEPVRVTFRAVLSNFNGPVRIGEARISVDPGSDEVVASISRDVRVFNEFGMEVFSFRSPLEYGAILDIAMEPDGGIVTLAYELDPDADDRPYAITRHDYRGKKIENVVLSGLSGVFDGFRPNRLMNDRDGLVVASTLQFLAIRVARDGRVLRTWDLAKILGIPREDVESLEITGIAVDSDGNLLVTIGSEQLAAAIVGDADEVIPFGKAGSAVGTFGNIGAIARDALGRVYVADKIRGVVLVFDDGFRFVKEFGPERTPEGSLGTPAGVWTKGSGRVYVTQVGERGVWVYDVEPN